ncbi:MAG: hypothetical protein U0166_08585 [Acidobacteriota bacterium]
MGILRAVFAPARWTLGAFVDGARAALHGMVAARRRLRTLRAGSPPSAVMLEEIEQSASVLRERLALLDPPRIDLEVSIDAAVRESRELARMLELLSEGSDAARHASEDRRRSLAGEIARIEAALEKLRAMLGNLEIDTLLSVAGPSRAGHGLQSLQTESRILRAAVDGADAARRRTGST